MKNLRKSLAIILCMVMCLSFLPTAAFAEDGMTEQETAQNAEVPAHEHAYIAEVKEPSCTEGGYTTYVCACGESYTDGYTDPLGHTPEAVEEIPASCTEPGRTAGMRCAVCGETLEGCEEIPAQGHTPELVEENPASATEPGRTAGMKCAVCEEILEGCEEIPVLEEELASDELTVDVEPSQAENTEAAPDEGGLSEPEQMPEQLEILTGEGSDADSGEASAGILASGSCGEHLIWTLDDQGTLRISGTGGMQSYSWTYQSRPWDAYSVTELIVENGVTALGNNAFCNQRQLSRVVLPEGIGRLPEQVFTGCINLREINFPVSLTVLDNECLWNTGIDTLLIPATITEVRGHFYGGPYGSADKRIETVSDHPVYAAMNGVLFTKDLSTLVMFPCCGQTNYTVPDGTTAIGSHAFAYNYTLETLYVPLTVSAIGQWAFASNNADTALHDIYYGGTINAWRAACNTMGSSETLQYVTVHCSDGNTMGFSQPICNGAADGPMGGGVHRFVVNVSNAQLVQFFVRDGAGHEKWYDTTDVNGDYICDVTLADFGNSVGTYQAGVYVYDLAGTARHIGEYTFNVAADEIIPLPVCNGSADGPMGGGVHRFVVNVSNAKLVQFFVRDGAGHEKWYDTTDVNGDYICDVTLADFGNSVGTYQAGVYVYDLAGTARHIGEYTFNVTADEISSVPIPTCNGSADGPMGGGVHRFVVNVSNAQLVQFFVRDGAGHEKWYNTTDVNGDYICDVTLADFGNSVGTYQAGVYVYDLAGTARHIGEYTFNVTADEISTVPVPVCNGSADGPMGGGVHRFVVNVSNAQLVQFFVRDGAGHEKWYNTTDVNGDYICDVTLADFSNSVGTYQAGVYVYDLAGTARHIGEYTFTVSAEEVN